MNVLFFFLIIIKESHFDHFFGLQSHGKSPHTDKSNKTVIERGGPLFVPGA